jgi:hypothetical protein
MFPRSPFRLHPPPGGTCCTCDSRPGPGWDRRSAGRPSDTRSSLQVEALQASCSACKSDLRSSIDRRSGIDRRRGPSNSRCWTALLSSCLSSGGSAMCPPPLGEPPLDRFRFCTGLHTLLHGPASRSINSSFGSFEPDVSRSDHKRRSPTPIRSAPAPVLRGPGVRPFILTSFRCPQE